MVAQLFDKCRDLSLMDLVGVYNQVSSGMEMTLSPLEVLSAFTKGYGLIAADADFVEYHIPQKGTYSYGSVGESSSLDVRWKTNKTRFHEKLNNP